MADSAWMVLSMTDPPRFVWHATPLVARGVAYTGRFSTIMIASGCALTVCALAQVSKHVMSRQ